jgi:hypothetical protein
LRSGLAGFKLYQEPDSDSCGGSQLFLSQTLSDASSPNPRSNFLSGHPGIPDREYYHLLKPQTR